MTGTATLHDATIFERDLPPVLAQLRDLIGIQSTLTLVEHFGGTHLQVPLTFRDDHLLVRLLGHQSALALINHFGADKLYIAKADYALRVIRNIEIARRYDIGTPVVQLARDYGLSERQIWNILKRPETLRAPPPQIDLFKD